METMTLRVPDVLGADAQIVEHFWAVIGNTPLATQYSLDMRDVSFVRPYGVIALVMAARRLATATARPVRLLNLDANVHLYLHRMDLFRVGGNWLELTSSLDDSWLRNPQTPNLLELTPITGPEDVEAVVFRASRIFSRWLPASNLGSLLSAISELTSNVHQHSGDPLGCALIQKYEFAMGGHVTVALAVGDLGCGIRQSLKGSHAEVGDEPLDYLREAMKGRSARSTGRGGLGLRRVEQIVETGGGYLWLRSDTAAIFSRGPNKAAGLRDLTFVPGTQVAAEIHAPLII